MKIIGKLKSFRQKAFSTIKKPSASSKEDICAIVYGPLVLNVAFLTEKQHSVNL